jgi:hypothetical protein
LNNTFKCGRCGKTFEKGWTDDEALEESFALFGEKIAADDRAFLCDPCNTVFKRWLILQPPDSLGDLPGAEHAQQVVRKELQT